MIVDLSGRIAIVTGSTGRIGFAIAAGLLAAGAAAFVRAEPQASATTGAALRVAGGGVDSIA